VCRVLGIIGNDDIVGILALGLYAQIYAGDHSAGIAAVTDGGILVEKALGKAIDVFPGHPDMQSKVAIGHNGCTTSELQPINLSVNGKMLALAVDATKEVTSAIATILNESRDVIAGVSEAIREITEPFALIVLSADHGLIAARNSGIKPLTIGKIEVDGLSGFYVASQSGVLLEGSFLDTIRPGSLRVINQEGFEEIVVLDRADPRHCINELLFKQRPGNRSGRREINEIRFDIGKILGARFAQYLESQPIHKPVIREYKGIAIPQGGIQFTIGFGQTSGIEVDPAGSVRAIYSVSTQMRESAKKLGLSDNFALSPLPNVAGRRIVLIDDQMRSGDKIAHMAEKCFAMGAKEVLAAVGSTGKSSCPYGDSAYHSEDLIDRRLSLSEISRTLGVSAIITLPLEELIQAIGTPERIYCLDCLC